jgi:16S rRNA (cytidine1402-2'-O)-methyltransferase
MMPLRICYNRADMGRLFLVATPIGNLEDISARARRTLREVTLIAAEDTRKSGKLLACLEIRTPMISYHEHNKLVRLDRILAALAAGDVALVSDAGTPGLNDPGYELVRKAIAAGYGVVPVPGPCAPVAALVASGLPTDSFVFLGYLPRRSRQRKDALLEWRSERRTLLALEVPHRLVPSLEDILEILGDRPLVAAREMTKIHEEFVRGTVQSAINRFRETPPIGEITLVIGGAGGNDLWREADVRRTLKKRISEGCPPGQASAEIAAASGWRKRDVYRLALKGKG